MIPIGDNIPSRNQPLVNYFLIGFNLICFLWELKLDITGELSSVVQTWGIVPERISEVALDAIASRNPAALVALVLTASSVLSAMFLHGSCSQILGNLLFLFVFGKAVENTLGHGRYGVFYLLCGILTSGMQIWVQPSLNIPLVGANGAIAAVLGAYLINFPQAKIDSILPLIIVFIPLELPALFYLFWWFVQQIFYGIGSLNIAGGVNPVDTAYWAHEVGLVIGAVFGWLMAKREERTLTRYNS